MADLMMGGEIGALIPSDGSVVEVVDTGNKYNTDRARCAVKIISKNSAATTPAFAAKDTLWVHWQSNSDPHFDNRKSGVVNLLASGTEILRVASTQAGQGNDTLQLEYLSGGVWTAVGSSQTFTTFATLHEFDLFFEKSTGTFKLYSAGSFAIGSAGVLALESLGAITQVNWRGNYDGGVYVSENVVSTDSTIGVAVYTRYPSGDGANTGYTGGFGNVDEIVYSDADSITSTSANQISTFTHSGVASLPTDIAVRGVCVASRSKQGGAPTGQQAALRISSTNYFSTTNVQDAGFGADVHVFATSPATSAAFTASEITGMEFGVKSIT